MGKSLRGDCALSKSDKGVATTAETRARRSAAVFIVVQRMVAEQETTRSGQELPRSACFGQRDACQWPVRDRVRRAGLGAAGVLLAALDTGLVFPSRLHSLLTVRGDVQGCSQCSGADNRTSHTTLFSSPCSHAHSACSSPLAKRHPRRRSVLRSVPAVSSPWTSAKSSTRGLVT